jgi:hypothetical protein
MTNPKQSQKPIIKEKNESIGKLCIWLPIYMQAIDNKNTHPLII